MKFVLYMSINRIVRCSKQASSPHRERWSKDPDREWKRERKRERGRERQRERERDRETRTSKLAHGGLIRSSLLTLLPAARLLCADVEREQRRPLRSHSGTSSPTKRTEPASIPHYVHNSHPLTLPLFAFGEHQPPSSSPPPPPPPTFLHVALMCSSPGQTRLASPLSFSFATPKCSPRNPSSNPHPPFPVLILVLHLSHFSSLCVFSFHSWKGQEGWFSLVLANPPPPDRYYILSSHTFRRRSSSSLPFFLSLDNATFFFVYVRVFKHRIDGGCAPLLQTIVDKKDRETRTWLLCRNSRLIGLKTWKNRY